MRRRVRRQHKAATAVQTQWRGRQARAERRRRAAAAVEARRVATERNEAAVRVQAVWRGHRGRVVGRRVRAERDARRRAAAAARIQGQWRMRQARAELRRRRAAKAEAQRVVAQRVAAATRIQTQWRGHEARGVLRQRKTDKAARVRAELEHRASTKVQRHWRQHRQNTMTKALQAHTDEVRQRLAQACVTLQRHVRGHAARRWMRRRQRAAIVVQQQVRGMQARALCSRLAAEKAERQRVAAEKAEAERLAKENAEQERVARANTGATKVQRQWRLHRQNVMTLALQAHTDEVRHRMAGACVTVQRHVRGHLHRRWVKRMVAEEEAERARAAAAFAEAQRIAREQAAQKRAAAEEAERQRLAAEKAEAEALHAVCKSGDVDTATAIVKAKFANLSDVDDAARAALVEPLRAAIAGNHPEVVQMLMHHGPEDLLHQPLPGTDGGNPPLLEALRTHSDAVVQALLDSKADASVRATDGASAAEVAVFEGSKVGRMDGWSVGRSVGRMDGRSVGRSDGWMVGRSLFFDWSCAVFVALRGRWCCSPSRAGA